MAKVASGSIIHAVSMRLRVTGSGSLRGWLLSLNPDNDYYELPQITMQDPTAREPTVLANYSSQRMQLELRTLSIDESFYISKVVVFVKPVAESYPIL